MYTNVASLIHYWWKICNLMTVELFTFIVKYLDKIAWIFWLSNWLTMNAKSICILATRMEVTGRSVHKVVFDSLGHSSQMAGPRVLPYDRWTTRSRVYQLLILRPEEVIATQYNLWCRACVSPLTFPRRGTVIWEVLVSLIISSRADKSTRRPSGPRKEQT